MAPFLCTATWSAVRAYDQRRNGIFPYRSQRNVARFGTSPDYGWSEEKARHYALPERADSKPPLTEARQDCK